MIKQCIINWTVVWVVLLPFFFFALRSFPRLDLLLVTDHFVDKRLNFFLCFLFDDFLDDACFRLLATYSFFADTFCSRFFACLAFLGFDLGRIFCFLWTRNVTVKLRKNCFIGILSACNSIFTFKFSFMIFLIILFFNLR